MESTPLTTLPIQALIDEFKTFDSETFAEQVTALVRETEVDFESLAPYVHYLDNGYTRNLIYKDERVEVLALCWRPGNASSIHNHRDQQCWMLVPKGKLLNQNYLVHDRDPAKGTCRLEESSSLLITAEAPMAVDPEEPVHQVRNLREFGSDAVSLHIYSNPFDTCEVYCPDKGIYRDVKLSYWSKHGVLVGTQQSDPCADN